MPSKARANPSSAPAARQKPDRRRHYRANLTLGGKFLSDGEDYQLVTENISCGGALIRSSYVPAVETGLVCYFDDIGRIATQVSRVTEDGFAVEFRTTDHKKDKIADRLIWLLNYKHYDLKDERRAPRKIAGTKALVTLSDGRKVQCRVNDISLTGASFEQDGPPLKVGEIIRAGTLQGEIVRSDTNGFAIRFLKKSAE